MSYSFMQISDISEDDKDKIVGEPDDPLVCTSSLLTFIECRCYWSGNRGNRGL